MKYYLQRRKDGNIACIGRFSGDIKNGEEITEAEYNRLLAEIRSKCDWVDKVCADPATIDLCPPEWRQEILQQVEERKAQEPKPTDDISAEELGEMIQEVL